MYVCMFLYVYVSMCACVHVYICVHMCTLHMWLCVCMCVCMISVSLVYNVHRFGPAKSHWTIYYICAIIHNFYQVVIYAERNYFSKP